MKTFIYILVFFVISLNNISISSSSSQEVEDKASYGKSYPTASQFPNTKTAIPEDGKGKIDDYYEGFLKENLKHQIQVENHLSLGGQYTEKVREAIRKSDQFVIFFMYRFNHPALIHDLADKFIKTREKKNNGIPLVFLDHRPFSTDKSYGGYRSYVRYLYQNVPLSFVRLQRQEALDQSKKFHHKVIVCKRHNEEALTFIGSANATYEADNLHSEDTLFIRSNDLAIYLLDNFNNFFTHSSVRIFDENRVESNTSNREYLGRFIEILQNSTKIIGNPSNPSLKYKGILTSLAISGFYNEKRGKINNKCLNLIENVISKQEGSTLLYFQNFFNIGVPNKGTHHFLNVYNSFIDQKNNSQLVVVWNDHSSKGKYIKSLQEDIKTNKQNSIIAFTPYTKGKFHHKAIIQYPKEGAPILYTGSFNFSESALLNNSEIIIGIEGLELVEDYLCSLLWNSDLADKPSIWEFFMRNETFLSRITTLKSPLYSLVYNVNFRNEKNIQRFFFRLRYINTLKKTLPENILSKKSLNILDKAESFKDHKNPNYMEISSSLDAISKDLRSIEEESMGMEIKQYIIELLNNILNELINNKLSKDPKTIKKFKKSVEEFRSKNDEPWIKSVQNTLGIIKSKRKSLLNMKRDILDIIYLLDDLTLLKGTYENLMTLKTALGQENSLRRKVENSEPVTKSKKSALLPQSLHPEKISGSNSSSRKNDDRPTTEDLKNQRRRASDPIVKNTDKTSKQKGQVVLQSKKNKKKGSNKEESSSQESDDQIIGSNNNQPKSKTTNTNISVYSLSSSLITANPKNKDGANSKEKSSSTEDKKASKHISKNNYEGSEELEEEDTSEKSGASNKSDSDNIVKNIDKTPEQKKKPEEITKSNNSTSSVSSNLKKKRKLGRYESDKDIDDFDVKIDPYLEQINQNFDYLESKTKDKLKSLGITKAILASEENRKKKWETFDETQKKIIEKIINTEYINPV